MRFYVYVLFLFLSCINTAFAHPLETAKWESLAYRHAPIIYLAQDETFFPAYADAFKSGAMDYGTFLAYPVGDQPDVDTIAQLKGYRPSEMTVPMHVSVVPRSGAKETVDVIYWFFYPYNQGRRFDLRDLRHLDHNFCHCYYGNHVGDWEHLTIRFVNEKPTQIFISQHSNGRVIDFSDRQSIEHEVNETGDHVVAYSAKGSHAVYAQPGTYNYYTKKISVKRKYLPRIHLKTIRLYDYASKGERWDGSKSLIVAFPNSNSTDKQLFWDESWLSYNGKWGNPEHGCAKPFGKNIGVCQRTGGPAGPNMKEVLNPSYLNLD